MSEDCIFCQIVAGEIPSHTVYEDEDTYAFLDVNPLARGHTLIIPKTHRERVNEMNHNEAAAVFGAVSEIVPAVEAAVDAPGNTIAINDGEQAGQEVPHVHCHVVPQFAGDHPRAIHALFDGADVADDELVSIAESVQSNL